MIQNVFEFFMVNDALAYLRFNKYINFHATKHFFESSKKFNATNIEI